MTADVRNEVLLNPMIEYIKRKNKFQRTIPGKRKDSVKAGVFVAGIDPQTSALCVGFSLCHRQMDIFDVVLGKDSEFKVPGFGIDIATKRALKWKDYQKSIFTSIPKSEMKEHPNTILIPSSLRKDGKVFIERCKRFYQNPKYPERAKQLPKWVEIFLL